jgi:hypothetical protein
MVRTTPKKMFYFFSGRKKYAPKARMSHSEVTTPCTHRLCNLPFFTVKAVLVAKWNMT